jgi:hypothetical protein
MAVALKLNDKQVEVLRWIAAGCPDGVMADDSHRISAAALRTRGLATTSGRGPNWTAKVTASGSEYLRRLGDGGLGFDDLSFDGLSSNGFSSGGLSSGGLSSGGLSSGGLSSGGLSSDGLELERLDGVGRYDHVAEDFRDRIERHEVSRAQLPRATKIVQTLVGEAQLRGWSVQTAGESENEVGLVDWSSAKDGHFQITAGESDFWLRLQEEGVRTRDVLEDDDAPEPFDVGGTGRLKLELRWGEWFTRKQTRWVDRPDTPLEERLGAVIDEISGRVADGERAARERTERAALAEADARAQAEDREREWERLMAVARERYLEDQRTAALLQQVEAFENAARIRAYCDAVVAAASGAGGGGAGGGGAAGGGAAGGGREPDADVVAWVEWARAYAERLDPLAGLGGTAGAAGAGAGADAARVDAAGAGAGADAARVDAAGAGVGPRAPAGLEPVPAALQAYLPEGWSVAGP